MPSGFGCLSLVAFMTMLGAPAGKPEPGAICKLKGPIRISAKPGGKGRKARVKKGTELELVSLEKKWAKLDVDGEFGYARLRLLQRRCTWHEPPAPEPDAAALDATPASESEPASNPAASHATPPSDAEPVPDTAAKQHQVETQPERKDATDSTPAPDDDGSASADATNPENDSSSATEAAALPENAAAEPSQPEAAEQSGPPRRLLFLPLVAPEVEDNALRILEDEIGARLAAYPTLEILARDELQALLDLEASRQSMGCSPEDSACLAEVGSAGNADLLLTGKLGRVGDTQVLSLTLLDPKSSGVEGRATATAGTAQGLLAELEQAIPSLLGQEAGTRVASSFDLEPGSKAAVFPLEDNGVGAEAVASLTQILALELKKVEGLEVISQDEIAAMLQLEADKQSVGCDDASCFAEIGGALGAKYLVIGSVGKLDETFLVNLKLIDTLQAKVLQRMSETFAGRQSDLVNATRFAVRQLVGAVDTTPGKLALHVEPDEIELRLDGELVERAERLEIPAGKYSLRIDADGYYSQYLETYVEPNRLTQMNLRLEEIPRPWYAQWWLWTSAVVVIGGGVVAAILLTQDDGNQSNTGSLELGFSR